MKITYENALKNREDIVVMQYLPLSKKSEMIEYLASNLIESKDNFKLINYIKKEFLVNLSLVVQYTNIDFSFIDEVDAEEHMSTALDIYDELYSSGLMEFITSKIPQAERDFISRLLDLYLNQAIKLENSVEGVLNNLLNNYLSKIPNIEEAQTFLNSMSKEITKINKLKNKVGV